MTANDSYLIVSSDGVFERLSLQDVCDLLWEVHTQGTVGSRFSSSCSHSLADCVVNTAFERGSMDNVAAVVIPLESTYVSDNLARERCLEDRNINSPCKGLQKFIYKQSGELLYSWTLLRDNILQWAREQKCGWFAMVLFPCIPVSLVLCIIIQFGLIYCLSVHV